MGAAGAPTGASKAPKGGAEGATPPEGEGNLAKGGYFASILMSHEYIYDISWIYSDISHIFFLYFMKKYYEIPAFGGISLALRWSGAFGATFGHLHTPVGAPQAPIWETTGIGGGKRYEKN